MRQGKGIEAGCHCRFDLSCEITVVLGVDRKKIGYVSCHLMTWWNPAFFHRFFRRGKSPCQECIDQWMQFCAAINEVVVEALGAISVQWLTMREANDFWGAADAAE